MVAYHLVEHHSDLGGDDTVPTIPGELLVGAFITSEEERLMGVDEDLTDDWREKNRIPDTDGIEEIREDLKCARAASTVSLNSRKSQRTSDRIYHI